MALRKKNKNPQAETPQEAAPEPQATTQAQPEPAQEAAPEPQATTQAQPEPAPAAQEPEVLPPEQPQATAPAPAPAVNTPAGGMVNAKQVLNNMLYADLENGFIANFNSLPRITASNGNFLDQEKTIMGTWITGQVYSWNKRWVISPGDDKAPNELVAYSMDGVTIEETGESIADYIAQLKANNWDNAAKKEYYDVVFNLTGCAEPSEHVGGLVTLQLSPTSKEDFNSFRLQTSFKMANGAIPQNAATTIQFTAKLESSKKTGKTWTRFKAGLITQA